MESDRHPPRRPQRRRFVAQLAAAATLPVLPHALAQRQGEGVQDRAPRPGPATAGAPAARGADAGPPLTRTIPGTAETLPVIGLGTWITFNVGSAPAARTALLPVVQAFTAGGGSMIDSSPMYGSSEAVVGDLLARMKPPPRVFAATKVWTYGRSAGERQLEASRGFWRVPRFDLVQIHNMLDWERHLEALQAAKAAGRIRYVGITTSHGRRHDELERVLARNRFDFVQFTYSLYDRDVEQRLLPLAAERGIAVVVNRPFDGGDMFRGVAGKPLPAWAGEIDCANWAQVFLKFIVSHPAVTCAIPATSNPVHMAENIGALYGRLPDAALRRRMAAAFDAL